MCLPIDRSHEMTRVPPCSGTEDPVPGSPAGWLRTSTTAAALLRTAAEKTSRGWTGLDVSVPCEIRCYRSMRCSPSGTTAKNRSTFRSRIRGPKCR